MCYKINYSKIDKIQLNKTLNVATSIRTRLAEVNPKIKKTSINCKDLAISLLFRIHALLTRG